MTHSLKGRLSLFLQPVGFWFLLLMLPVAASPAENKTEQFQAFLDAAVKSGVKAVSAHVSWDTGSRSGSWSGTAGETSADSGEPLGPDSLFRIASITKLFTATVILQLVDENILQLGDTLAERLKEGSVLDIPNADSITIEMLLDHTNGIRNYSAVDDFWAEAYGDGGLDRTWEPDELISYALRERPYFAPGAAGQRQYSNSNYILLGMIIEDVTGDSLSSAFRQRLYEPLGLEHTLLEGFDDGLSEVQHSFMKTGFRNRIVAISRGWNRARNGLYDVSGNYRLYNAWAWAAGGIATTADDLDRFLVAVRDGSLLSEAGQDLLFLQNSAEGSAGVVFGGNGGWEGIASSASEIDHDVRIVVLVNTTGFDVNANTLRVQLYRVLKPLP